MVWRDSVPRIKTLLVLPRPPLDAICTDAVRASTSGRVRPAERSMASRSTTTTSLVRVLARVATRVAVTTVSDRARAGAFCASAGSAHASARVRAAGRRQAGTAAAAQRTWVDELVMKRKTQSTKVTPAGFPAGAWAITAACCLSKTGARNHGVGRYPGWRSALQRLPRRLFKAPSGMCVEGESGGDSSADRCGGSAGWAAALHAARVSSCFPLNCCL